LFSTGSLVSTKLSNREMRRTFNIPSARRPGQSPPAPVEQHAIHHVETNRVVNSGDIFEVTTETPEELPLPSWDFLSMMCIAALQGAGEDEEDDVPSDEDTVAVPSD
jgi:hypothetical protein